MVKLQNINSVPAYCIDDPAFEGALKTLYLGYCAGSERIYVNIDFVKPGSKSVKYHAHSAQEEFFLILSGEGTLRYEDNEIAIKKGDFFAKLPGSAHQFINTSNDVLEILDAGTRPEEDVVTYPDENVTLKKPEREAYRNGEKLEDWSSDPN